MIIANKKKIGEIIIDLGICVILFYFILVLFWIDAHENIFVLPYKYFMDSFSLNVGWPYNLTNGVYTSSKEVPNLYLIINYIYKLPEFIVLLYLISIPLIFYKFKTLKKNIKNFLTKISLLLILLIFPNLILIYIKYPIYDGLRLFLWFTPYLVIIPAIVFSYLINDNNFFLNQ